MRDILVFSESFKRWGGSVEYAARLACAFDAHLTGIWVCASPMAALPSFEEPELFAELLDATLDLEKEAAASAAAFEAHVLQLGQRKASWQVAEGYVPEALALAGSWHDLLVTGRSDHAAWGSLSSVGNIVLGAGDLPCIVVPEHAPTQLPALDTVAIAWNGSIEAMRAVHAALPLLQSARRVVILRGEQRPPVRMTAWLPPFDLAGYLLRHGMTVESRTLRGGSEDDVGAALLGAAGEVGAGLLVMGAYGHTRFREWVLGGVTRHVLAHAALPVLLRH
ncbi:universal stress protein [Rhodanobacter aciditrophus]|uniref:universal stress protein n=1 Tax=Rhodanobacter aciditrophus TaxID=1623218 RepID=UPI003CED74E3